MVPVGVEPVRLGVVGGGSVDEALSGLSGDVGDALAVETLDSAVPDRTDGDGELDCLLVDAGCDDDPVEVVDTWADSRPALPVLVLTDDGGAGVVADALASGATGTLPSGVVESDPELVAERVVEAVEREYAHAGFRDLYDGVGEGVALHDPETGEIVDANGTLRDLLGYPRESVQSMTPAEVTADVPGYDGERARKVVRSVGRGQGTVTLEWPFEDADGTVRWTDSRLATVSFGPRDLVMWSATEVTERRRTEQTYREVFDNVNDVISVHDPWAEEMVDVNETLTDLTGYDRETLLEMDVEGVSATDDGYTQERAYDLLQRVAATGDPETVEWVVETADGDRRHLEVNLAPATIAGEERVLALSRDVTARERLERTYRDLFENVADGLVIHDPETGEIADVNEQYCELTGYSRDELVGSNIRTIIPEDPEDTFEDAMEWIARAREEGPQLFEFEGQRKDGRAFVGEVHLAVVEVRGEERVLASVRDVTERKRREREYEQIFDGVQDGIAVMDPDTLDILDANEAYLDMVGYDDLDTVREQGVEGLSATAEGYTVEAGRQVHRRVAETGEAETVEWRAETSGGEHRWLEVKVTPAVIGGDEVNVAIHRDVTERRRREREYEQVFNAVNDAIAVRDPETGAITDVNESYAELLGYDREEMVGLSIGDVGVTEAGYTDQRGEEVLDRVMANKGPVEFEWWVETADGDRRLLDVTATAATIGGRERYLAIGRDITERHEYERQLRRERDRRSQLFENNPDPIVEVEFEAGRPTITAVNDAFESVFGFDADSLGGQTVAEALVPESERDQYERLLERSSRGETIETEVCRQTASGVREFRLHIIPFDVGDDEQRAYVWYSDVTERNRRQRELEEERERYSTLVEQSTDGVVVVQDAEYVFVNDRFCEITGYDRDQLLGLPFYEVFTDDYRDLVRDRYEKRVAGESPPARYDAEIATADGAEVTLELAVSHITHEGEPATLANLRDVTDRRRRERAVRALADATEAMQDVDTREGVAEAALDAVREALDLPLAVCWWHDDDAGRLEPAVATDPVREAGLVSPLSADRYEYEVFREGAVMDYVPSDVSDENPLETGVLLPLGDHGMVAAGRRDQVAYGDVVLGVARTLAEHTETALDRVERAEEVRESEQRLRTILNRIDDAIFLTRAEEIARPSADPDYLSAGYEKIWGQSLSEIVSTHEEGFVDTLHPEDGAEYRSFVEGIVRDIDEGDAADRYSLEYRIERPDGETRWVESDYYPVEWGTGRPRVVVVSRDVTDRKERERRIASFDEATDDLATADSTGEATRTAVEAATETLGLPAVGAFLYDDDEGVLRPEVLTGPLSDGSGAIGPGDGPLWEAFAAGGTVTSESGGRNGTDAGGGADDSTDAAERLAPLAEWRAVALGNHGLLVVGSPDGALDSDTVQTAHVLAATLEAALNHLRGQRRLEDREERLRTQTERAKRLDRIARLTQQVESAITEASGPGEVERAVCERLADDGPYGFAWIGGVDVGTDRIAPRAAVGVSRQYVERLGLTTTGDGADAHPAVRAWQTDAVRVAESVVGDGPTGDWRQRALTEGYQSLCAVPLTYDGVTHGVLTVGAESPNAFDAREREVLDQLGTSVGYALAATERRRALESDETVELEFAAGTAELPFARAAREAGCRVRHERTVSGQDGSVGVYFSFDGSVPDDVADVAGRTLPGDVDVVTDEAAETLVETRTDEWFGAPLAEYGAVLREASATPDETTLTVEVPAGADVRSFVDRIQELAPSLDLVAKRQHQQRDRTPTEVSDRLAEELTDRQLEVLRTALAAGYFEWPRESDGSDVADRLDITQPTLNKHLRLAERKTFELLLDVDA